MGLARRLLASGLWRLRGVLKRAAHWPLLRELRVAENFASPKMQEKMLLDTARCEAYRDALARTVGPQDVVVDLGAGTGLLSFFAVQAGAKRVYAIELGPIADLTRQLIEQNGLGDRVILVRGNSRHVDLPERGDLLVTETLSTCGFDNENIIEYVADARRRMLKPGSRIIPESSDTVLMPVHSGEFGLGRMPERVYGWDYSLFRRALYQEPETVQASGKRFVELAEPIRCWHVDYHRDGSAPGAEVLEFSVLREGRLDGFLGWFDAVLTPGVPLSNSPRLPLTNWSQMYFPVLEQPRLRAGQRLRLEIDPRLVDGEPHWGYEIRVASPV
ncbi:MAG: 50S ribosomal protein L11 methyltransferase [Armatimonadota bacterium]